MCVVCLHLSTGVCVNHRRASEPLELELQVIMSCPMWVLGPELKSSGRAVCTLTAEPSLSPEPTNIFFPWTEHKLVSTLGK